MTEIVEIKIQKVWPPFPDAKIWKDGKKRGKIVTAAGAKYQVAETIIGQFSDGDICKVDVKKFGDKDNPGFEIVGRVSDAIKSAVAQAAESQSNGQAMSGAAQEYSRARTNPVDSDRMGTMGMVNAFISIGAVAADADAIANLIKKCRDGLHRGWAE